MKKINIFILLTGLIFSTVYAQDEDYVISNPKRDYIKLNIDSNILSNPDYTNYFLTSSAFTLKKKNIRLSGTDIIFVKGSYGLTDKTMASVNISLFGTFAISIKHQININENLKIGITASGGQILFIPKEQINREDTNIYYAGGQALITLGDKQNNITVGTGFYYAKSSFNLINEKKELYSQTIYISGQKQLGRRWYLMAEVIYFVNYQIFTGAIGTKFIMGKRMSINIGLMPFGWNNPVTNKVAMGAMPIPLISFRFLLGKY